MRIAEEIRILRPSCSQRIDLQDAAKVLVEAHSAVHSPIALATPRTTALKTAIDHIGHPAKAEFAPSCFVCRTLRLRAQEDVVAAGFASLPKLWKTRPAGEPEPDRGAPGQGWIRGHPARIVQQDALVSTELLAELSIIVVVRQLLRTATPVLLPSRALIDGIG